MSNLFLKLTKQLYPTGRAYKMARDSDFEKLNIALNVSEEKFYNDARAVLNTIIPDNDLFSEEDAAFWEHALGLITNISVSLADRKLAILRKMKHPGLNPAKQHYLYLEGQLRAAGFDVYVYENRFPGYPDPDVFVTRTPLDVGGPSILSQTRYNTFRYGQRNYGVSFNNIIANSIYENVDANFDVGPNFGRTFFIGGNPIGTFANVDANRKLEFRQTILRIKPVQTVGFLFINYI